MSLRHQVRGRQTDVQHDKVGGDADMCNADHSLSFKSTSSCSRGTSSRRGSQRTASKLSNGNRNNLTDATHSRQENRKKLKAHGLKKNMNRDDFRSKQQENSEAANCKPSLLPPIKPQGAPMQHTPSPSRYPIHRLGNQLWDLQQQPAASATEIQLIKCPDGHQEVVLQHLKNWGNKQPQVLIQHSNTVYTLQELVQQAWARNRALVRQLNATKARLQSICNALWKQQQQLSQEWSLGEREKLVQHISALTLDLDLKNKRIQDLEKNLELTNASFNHQLSSQIQKTHQARDLSESLQEEINYLKQKISEQVQLLEIRNIYSYRFSERPPRKAAKESKSIQTDQLCPVLKDVATSTAEVEHRSSEDVKTTLKEHINMGSCNEHNCNTQEVSTIEYTERKNSGSSAQHGPTVDETANHENPSTEAVTDDGKSKGRDFSEEEQEALLQVLENYTDAENNGNKIQGGDLKPCQDDDSEWAEQDASNTTYPPQRPSSAILQTLIIAENAAVQLQRPHPEPAPLDPDLQHTKAATGEELCHPQ